MDQTAIGRVARHETHEAQGGLPDFDQFGRVEATAIRVTVDTVVRLAPETGE